MKAIVLFLIVASQCAAQDALRGAYGLDFGSSRKTVQEFAALQDWETIKTWRTDVLIFQVDRGCGSSELQFWFDGERLTSIQSKTHELVLPVISHDGRYRLEFDRGDGRRITPLKRTGDCHTMCEYQKLVAALHAQFGNPSASRRDFRGAMIWGDERDVQAVKAGRAIIRDEWRIPAAQQNNFSSVSSEITIEGNIGITFRELAAPPSAAEQKHR